MKVVLHHPQIPQNTGSIGRICVATKTPLCLVQPLGFFIDSKEVKRAGLDYWQHLDLSVWENFDELKKAHRESKFWYFSTKGKNSLYQADFEMSDLLVFGSETNGLPKQFLEENEKSVLKLPMWGEVRSLNLAVSVGIALYEAYRQINLFKKSSEHLEFESKL